MNATNLRLVADAIERSTTYDQSCWLHTCGYPACIAGHAAALSLRAGEKLVREKPVTSAAPWLSSIWKDGERGEAVADRAAEFLGCKTDDAVFDAAPAGDEDDDCIGWPEPFRTQWAQANDDRAKEKLVAVAYLRQLAEEADRAERAP